MPRVAQYSLSSESLKLVVGVGGHGPKSTGFAWVPMLKATGLGVALRKSCAAVVARDSLLDVLLLCTEARLALLLEPVEFEKLRLMKGREASRRVYALRWRSAGICI